MSRALETLGKYKYLLLLLLLGLILLLWPTGGGSGAECEGAESARVRLDIVNAVSAYTGFGSDRIKVLSMERSD